MSNHDMIGLAELINQVKQELLTMEEEILDSSPLFSIDEIELELQVTIKKEAKAGLTIHVVEVGGGTGRDDLQKITVKLTPILSKDERVNYYKNRYPKKWSKIISGISTATIKGSNLGDDLDDFYNAEAEEN